MDRRPKFAERREARRLRQLRCGDYVFEPWLLRAAVRNAIITFRETGNHEATAQGIELEFRPTDFIQINTAINRQMIERVLRLLELDGTHRVLDLFCGLGNFTLPLARHAGEVVGVEGDAGLVERARGNAIRNGIGNATFHLADLAASHIEAPWAGVAYERVLLDPPRSGAAAALDFVGNIRPARVVYVSCHPGFTRPRRGPAGRCVRIPATGGGGHGHVPAYRARGVDCPV